VNAMDLIATLRLSDGRRWIEAAHPFQHEDVQAVLEGPEPYNFLTRSRGSSKTTDLGAVALAMLLTAPDRSRLYWLAADREQGQLAVDAVAGFASRTPAVGAALDVQTRKVGSLHSGASLEVLPADAPGAWGLNPFAVFVDELANWHDGPAAQRLWEAASSAAAKRSDSRMVVLTTAGSPDHFAAKVIAHARTSKLWRVHERHGPAPWADPERLAEQRERLPAAVYEQLFENRWTAAEGSFLDPAVIDAAFTLEGPSLSRGNRHGHVAGLDLGHAKDPTAFAVGHREGDLVILDRLEVWKPSRLRPLDFAEVERFIVAAHNRYRFTLRLDPWQGLDLAQRLRAKGIHAEEFTFTAASKQRLASTLLQSLNSGHLHLYEAEGLRDELLKLRLKQGTAGTFTFDHTSGGHDDRAVAIALMAVAALERGDGRAKSGPPIWGSPSEREAWKRKHRPQPPESRPPSTRDQLAELDARTPQREEVPR